MNSEGFQGVPGVPDGWELVEFRTAVSGDCVIDVRGCVMTWGGKESVYVYPIIREVETPKKYRPFANAEEFKPHRHRWWAWKDDRNNTFPPAAYGAVGHSREGWLESFERKVFDDGTPFGVEVIE